MAIFETVKNGFSVAVDTVSSVTQTIIEKNRTNAQLNRLRTVMRNEAEMINRAYITLGKKYYENKINNRTEECENEAQLFEVIENSKKQIKIARDRYRRLIESQSVEVITQYDIGDLEDITVACSNEDEYDEKPFETPAEEASEPTEATEEAQSEVQVAVAPEVAEDDAF